MKAIFLKTVCILAFIGNLASAQIYRNVAAGSGGQTIRAKRTDSEVTGSPYLKEEWLKGKVEFASSFNTTLNEFKYDLMDDLLVVKGSSGEEEVFSDPIKGFSLFVDGSERTFKSGFKGQGFSERNYFEVLYDGKIKYLKKEIKSVVESKGYNSASVTKKIESSIKYFLVKQDGQLVEVKNNEKSFTSAMGADSKFTEMVKEMKTNFKKQEEVVTLLKRYEGS